MNARPAGQGRKARRDPVAGVNAFADRLLYDGWLEDNRRDRIKLMMIRAIVEWAQGHHPQLTRARLGGSVA